MEREKTEQRSHAPLFFKHKQKTGRDPQGSIILWLVSSFALLEEWFHPFLLL